MEGLPLPRASIPLLHHSNREGFPDGPPTPGGVCSPQPCSVLHFALSQAFTANPSRNPREGAVVPHSLQALSLLNPSCSLTLCPKQERNQGPLCCVQIVSWPLLNPPHRKLTPGNYPNIPKSAVILRKLSFSHLAFGHSTVHLYSPAVSAGLRRSRTACFFLLPLARQHGLRLPCLDYPQHKSQTRGA